MRHFEHLLAEEMLTHLRWAISVALRVAVALSYLAADSLTHIFFFLPYWLQQPDAFTLIQFCLE